MRRVVARGYLLECDPQFPLPRQILPNLYLVSTSTALQLTKSEVGLQEKYKFSFDLIGGGERNAIMKFATVLTGIYLASSCSIQIAAYDFLSTGIMHVTDRVDYFWGHFSPILDESTMHFASKNFQSIYNYIIPEKFNRIANSLRLYNVAMHTHNCDLALLGFIGSLESLFSISPQELSFRLSVLVGKFLGEDPDSHKSYFERAKDLYKIRSKIAHGDKINNSEEAAAISMTEYWTPEAEKLSRSCLRQMFDSELSDIFESRKLLEDFLTELIFVPNRLMAASNTRDKYQK